MLGVLCLVLAPHGALAEVQAPGEHRDRLTVEELAPDAPISVGLVHDGYYMPIGPVHNDYFMPIGSSNAALHELSGVLEVPETDSHSVYGRFPGFAVEFFTHGGHLVPAERDIIPGRGSIWNLVLSPGRVWSEPGDGGWSRASFPFVLTGTVWNESHNGIASFLYNETEVSALRVQIVQEAASWNRFDGWAQLPLVYTPGPIENRRTVEVRFAEEVAQHIPMRPWSELEGAYDPRQPPRCRSLMGPTG